MDDVLVERVLRIVELIPESRVTTYGTIGIVADCSPRYVGRVMAEFGSNVTWWRVVNASGALPAPLLARAREAWTAEGIRHTGTRVHRTAFLDVEELDGLWRLHGHYPVSG